MITCRSFREQDLAAALSLIAESGATVRTERTWTDNALTAVLACDGNTPVGIIPVQPRNIATADGGAAPTLWISGAYVRTAYQGKGIGRQLDAYLCASFRDRVSALFAFRPDRDCPAYRWYLNCGYTELLSIYTLKRQTPSTVHDPAARLLPVEELTREEANGLLERYTAVHIRSTGVAGRDAGFWNRLPVSHYYKDHYTYALILPRKGPPFDGYVLIGYTRMKDDIPRIDILELTYRDLTVRGMLITALYATAREKGVPEIRVSCARTEPDFQLFTTDGFSEYRQIYLLAKSLDPRRDLASLFEPLRWKHQHVDYV